MRPTIHWIMLGVLIVSGSALAQSIPNCEQRLILTTSFDQRSREDIIASMAAVVSQNVKLQAELEKVKKELAEAKKKDEKPDPRELIKPQVKDVP